MKKVKVDLVMEEEEEQEQEVLVAEGKVGSAQLRHVSSEEEQRPLAPRAGRRRHLAWG